MTPRLSCCPLLVCISVIFVTKPSAPRRLCLGIFVSLTSLPIPSPFSMPTQSALIAFAIFGIVPG
eukprot:1591816-Prorocentrum_lima.AAC.1